jgi:RNA polymerase sigma factor (sigma-70 family)
MNPFVTVRTDKARSPSVVVATTAVVGDADVSAESVFHEHWINMYRLATMLVANPETGEEIAQEAFTRWYARKESVDHPGAYLRTLVVNLANGHHRKRTSAHRWRHLFDTDGTRSTGEPGDVMSDMINALPPRQKAVVVLRYFEGCSEAEIADILQCRPGTVKSAMSRALETLRAGLQTEERP